MKCCEQPSRLLEGARLLVESKIHRVKYWKIIPDNLSKAGWSWSCVLAVGSRGRTIWIADAHRGDGKRMDEKLTAFMEMESAIHGRSPSAALR